MKTRTASLQVAHQKGCANETRSGMDSLIGCTCKPSYYTLYRDADGRKVKGDNGEGVIVGRTRRKRDAERWLEKLQERLEKNLAEPVRQKAINLPSWVDEYSVVLAGKVRRGELAASTERGYHETLRMAVASLGHIDLRAIGNREIDQFLESLGEVSAATRARRLRELGACLNVAAGRDYLERDPIGAYRKTEGRGLKVPKRGTDPYTDDELPRLWAALQVDGKKAVAPVYLAICRAAVATGARQGELIALDWTDLDLTNATLTIRHTFGVDGLTLPKDKEPRMLHLTPHALEVFGDWIKEAGVHTSGPIFTGPRGERLNGDYLWRVLERARKNAGVPKLGESGLRRTFHSFRDTFARQQLEAGKHPQWVSRQLGHSGLDLTINVYGRWSDEAMRAEAEKVPG